MSGRIRSNLKNVCEYCGKRREEFSNAKSFWQNTCTKNKVKCDKYSLEFSNKVSLKTHIKNAGVTKPPATNKHSVMLFRGKIDIQ